MSEIKCPLCCKTSVELFLSTSQKISGKVHQRQYWSCPVCFLVFLSPNQRLSQYEEKLRYELHNNDLQQNAYRAHLNKLWQPLKKKLQTGAVGLDYGSGPQPALAMLVAEAGWEMATWDPFFSTDTKVFAKNYDFICCMEVIEHCFFPGRELTKMISVLKDEAYLAIGTSQLIDDNAFLTWRYRMDPTHVCFWRPQTVTWVAQHWQFEIVYQTDKVVIFHKN
ncbi:MAG: class I SAM-dependent methyltransferase, partial [Bdellovibrionales bacterium]|nr:class I SAM-dependent methyltransferase [Bdellovibrionales bacterium]